MVWMVFSLEPTAGSRVCCSCSIVLPLHPERRKVGAERMAFLNLPLFEALSETIRVIELSIWQFVYDKGVITQQSLYV